MIVSKAPKQTKVKTSPASKSAAPELCASQDCIQDSIRERAFHIYESRGSEPGNEIEDWLRAELQLLEQ